MHILGNPDGWMSHMISKITVPLSSTENNVQNTFFENMLRMVHVFRGHFSFAEGNGRLLIQNLV